MVTPYSQPQRKHGKNTLITNDMTAKEFLQSRHPYMRKHWNENEVINDEWIVQEMEQYAKEQAVGFFNWIHDNNRLSDVIEGKFTISDLYDQFKQQMI